MVLKVLKSGATRLSGSTPDLLSKEAAWTSCSTSGRLKGGARTMGQASHWTRTCYPPSCGRCWRGRRTRRLHLLTRRLRALSREVGRAAEVAFPRTNSRAQLPRVVYPAGKILGLSIRSLVYITSGQMVVREEGQRINFRQGDVYHPWRWIGVPNSWDGIFIGLALQPGVVVVVHQMQEEASMCSHLDRRGLHACAGGRSGPGEDVWLVYVYRWCLCAVVIRSQSHTTYEPDDWMVQLGVLVASAPYYWSLRVHCPFSTRDTWRASCIRDPATARSEAVWVLVALPLLRSRTRCVRSVGCGGAVSAHSPGRPYGDPQPQGMAQADGERAAHDQLVSQVVHQAQELWLQLASREAVDLVAELDRDALWAASSRVERICRVLQAWLGDSRRVSSTGPRPAGHASVGVLMVTVVSWVTSSSVHTSTHQTSRRQHVSSLGCSCVHGAHEHGQPQPPGLPERPPQLAAPWAHRPARRARRQRLLGRPVGGAG
uniref:SocE n=1 Tax=Myxococcus xanthus TaxID=34 RepID=Q9KHC4_MYXXA|nr:SocE [Myxococcus xanthus]